MVRVRCPVISLAIRPASGHARIRACQKGPVPRLLLPAWLAAVVAATRMCKSPQRTARASAPARARTGPSPLTRRRAAAAAPSRHSDFRRCFERCHGANVRLPPLAAPTAPQPASACWARWSLPLRARSGPREPTAPTFRLRIRACFAARNTRHRAGRPGRRGAAGRGSGKVRAKNLPHLRTPRAGVAPAAPLRKRIPPLCPALVQLTNDRCNLVRRRQPRRRCLQRGAGGTGAPVRTPLDAGSGLRRARRESSTRPAARPSASAGSCLLPAGSQASWKASADCARTTPLRAGLFAISGRPLRSVATAGGQLRWAGSIPASVDASGAPFSSCALAVQEIS